MNPVFLTVVWKIFFLTKCKSINRVELQKIGKTILNDKIKIVANLKGNLGVIFKTQSN